MEGEGTTEGGDTGGEQSAELSGLGTVEGGGESTEGGSSEGNGSAPPAAKPQTYKITRLGQEREVSLEDLQRMASDDWEDEFKINGEMVRARLPELVRRHQLERTSFQRIEDAKTREKQLEAERAKGRENPLWYLSTHLGVEDPRAWLFKNARSEIELEQLAETDPREYAKRLIEREREETARAAARKEAEEKRAAQERSEQEWNDGMRQALPKALQGAGLPPTQAFAHRVASTLVRARSAGADITPEDAAAIARRDAYGETHDWLGTMDGEGLLAFLGDKLREKIRAAELAVVKGKQATTTEQTPAPVQTRRKPAEEPDYRSPADFMNDYR